MRARWYDPAVGRFISEDPGRNGGNWYAYALLNPTNSVDRNGKEPFLVTLGEFFRDITDNSGAGGLGVAGTFLAMAGACLMVICLFAGSEAGFRSMETVGLIGMAIAGLALACATGPLAGPLALLGVVVFAICIAGAAAMAANAIDDGATFKALFSR
jgi:hypothetical protein